MEETVMESIFEPVSEPTGSTFEVEDTKSASGSKIFEPLASSKGCVFESVGTASASPTHSYKEQASTQEYESVCCSVCGNTVNALVLEKTAMCNKYKCTYPGCGALFSTPGTVARGAKILGTTIGVVNAGIGLIKILGGDPSGIADIFHSDSTEL
jgi:hypothetical protein